MIRIDRHVLSAALACAAAAVAMAYTSPVGAEGPRCDNSTFMVYPVGGVQPPQWMVVELGGKRAFLSRPTGGVWDLRADGSLTLAQVLGCTDITKVDANVHKTLTVWNHGFLVKVKRSLELVGESNPPSSFQVDGSGQLAMGWVVKNLKPSEPAGAGGTGGQGAGGDAGAGGGKDESLGAGGSAGAGGNTAGGGGESSGEGPSVWIAPVTALLQVLLGGGILFLIAWWTMVQVRAEAKLFREKWTHRVELLRDVPKTPDPQQQGTGAPAKVEAEGGPNPAPVAPPPVVTPPETLLSSVQDPKCQNLIVKVLVAHRREEGSDPTAEATVRKVLGYQAREIERVMGTTDVWVIHAIYSEFVRVHAYGTSGYLGHLLPDEIIDVNQLFEGLHAVWERAKGFIEKKGYKLIHPRIDASAQGYENLGDQTSSRVRKEIHRLARELQIRAGHVIDVVEIGWTKGVSPKQARVVAQWPGNLLG